MHVTATGQSAPSFFTFQAALSARWAPATAQRTTRQPGEPGVRLRCYRDPPGHQIRAASVCFKLPDSEI
ncbi:DUF6207 family protein [Streptomyces jeddahensis]|uniref:DUF6207 family protein n=1 Tax=Streptomyces jeddahensis TaxID=1716141 RepID=UPI0022B7F476|nr:DUF6207 family protein [Streptomyces jeddahensis]